MVGPLQDFTALTKRTILSGISRLFTCLTGEGCTRDGDFH